MKRVKGYLLTLVVLTACPIWDSSDARIYLGEGMWCDVNNVYIPADPPLFPQGGYQTVVGNCLFSPPFTYAPTPPIGPPFGGGNSGGSSGPTTFPDLPISQKLNCALQKYTNGLTQKAGKSFKKVDAWAFRTNNGYGWGYKILASSTPPGPEWQAVGGIALYTITPPLARLYNEAFQGRPHFERNGTPPRNTSLLANSLNGAISDFEMSLFAGAHELAHLSGIANDGSIEEESYADWFGIFAVLKYREDGGSKCAGLPD